MNAFRVDSKSLVSKVPADADIKQSVKQAIDLIGGIDKAIQPGDNVTLKPNLNTPDPFPASSDPDFIRAIGELILEAGASTLRIVESSTLRTSTRVVAAKVGLDTVAEEIGAEMVYLDEHDWVKVKFPKGKYLKSGSIGKALLETEKLVLAPCIKTHKLARFTGAMKLFVGWIRPRDRLLMHARRLEPKIADLASYFSPSLIVMDGRRCFVTGGPASGQEECSNVILASGDIVAIDVEGVRLLQSYNASNRLSMDVWEVPQIRHAASLGIGASSDKDIRLVEPV